MFLTYKIIGTIAVIAFIALFTAGVVMDSSPYRAQLNSPSFNLTALLAVMLTYTPSNVAFLALLYGLIAGCSSILTHGRVTHASHQVATEARMEESATYRTESPVASMFRSLVAYLAFMAGVLITTVSPFTTTTPEQYVRLAAAVSFFAFIVGYDPTKFRGLLNTPLPRKGAAKVKG